MPKVFIGFRTSAPVGALRAGLVLVTLAAAACEEEGDGRAAQSRYAHGMELLAAGEAEHARTEFSFAIELDKTHVPSRLQLARLDDARGDWNAAVRGYTAVLAVDPQSVEAHERLAYLMSISKQFGTAKYHASAAYELAPKDASVLATLALVDQAAGDAAAASDWLTLALESGSTDPTTWLAQAQLAADAGETGHAIDKLEVLLAEDPANMWASLLAVRLLNEAGREVELRELLARMAALFPDIWIKAWLADLREQAGDASGAYEMLKTISEQQPHNIDAALDVIGFVNRIHGADAARDEFASRITAADPAAAPQLRLEFADFENAAGRPEEAANILAALVDEAPNSVAADTARIRLAGEHLASGDREEAKRIVDAVLQRDPQRPDAVALRAALLIEAGEADEAIGVLRAALDVAPDDFKLALELARAYRLAGHEELARERFEFATRTSDFDPGVVAVYARFLSDTKRRERAIFLLEAAAHRHPEDEEIRAMLEAARSSSNGG